MVHICLECQCSLLSTHGMLRPMANNLCDAQARFHVWAQHELCEQPEGATSNLALPFDGYQNMQQLNKILDMLVAMFEPPQLR